MVTIALASAIVAVVSVFVSKESLAKINLVAIVAYVVFPGVVSAAILGAEPGDTYLEIPVALGFIVSLATLFRIRPKAKSNFYSVGVFLFFFGLLLSVIFTFFGTGRSGLIGLFNSLIGPFVIALGTFRLFSTWPDWKRKFIRLIVALGIAQAAIALLQFGLQQNIFYDTLHASYQTWYRLGVFSRAQGTFSHPLVMSTFLNFALGLTISTVRQSYIKWPISVAMLAGILLTQSRAGFAIAILLILFGIITITNVRLITSILASGISAWLIWNLTSIQDGLLALFSKASNDYGSTQSRLDSFALFISDPIGFLFSPGGFTSSFELKNSSILNASLENGALMWLYDLGLVSTLCLMLGFLLMVGLSRMGKTTVIPIAVTFLVTSFSSIAASPLTTLVWLTSMFFISNSALHTLRQGSLESNVVLGAAQEPAKKRLYP